MGLIHKTGYNCLQAGNGHRILTSWLRHWVWSSNGRPKDQASPSPYRLAIASCPLASSRASASSATRILSCWVQLCCLCLCWSFFRNVKSQVPQLISTLPHFASWPARSESGPVQEQYSMQQLITRHPNMFFMLTQIFPKEAMTWLSTGHLFPLLADRSLIHSEQKTCPQGVWTGSWRTSWQIRQVNSWSTCSSKRSSSYPILWLLKGGWTSWLG